MAKPKSQSRLQSLQGLKRNERQQMDALELLKDLPLRNFGVILADPPWSFKSYTALQMQNPESGRHVERHYDTMSLDDIKALPIASLAAPTGCHLFLWATGPCLPQAFEVMEAWGFKYSSVAFTWAKLKRSHVSEQMNALHTIDSDFHVGLGLTTRKNCEFCLLGRRGNARRNAKDVREILIAPVREHSRKPDEAHRRIERYADGPYLELFGREQHNGWTVRGDQVGKFK